MSLKNYILFFLIINFGIYFFSCNKSNDDPQLEETINLSATPLSFEVSADVDTVLISITSNTNWEISGSANWCHPSILSSEGDANIELYIDSSKIEEKRSTKLIISADGANDIEVLISQAAQYLGPMEPDHISSDNSGMRLELTAIDFSKLLGLGWNLGNSLEAISVSNGVYSGGETSWGNPVVNKRLIDSVKAAGFNTVRIPVSWSHKILDGSTNQIKWSWKLRVQEVVNYVLENDMYAIINIHWDGGWMNQPLYHAQDEINSKINTFWKQIAIHFRSYDDHLIFAGTNEVHIEGNWATPGAENIAVQNSFNHTFIDAVRATGGRNTYRHLIIQAYNTHIEYANNFLTIPNDPTDDRLMVEVHFYDPYDFTLMESGDIKTLWGKDFVGGVVSSWGQEAWVDQAFDDMKTGFVDLGCPVVLGEYGALLRSSLSGSALSDHISARNYYLEYITQAAMDNGLVPFYWDNGYTGNNGFGLFNRETGESVFPESIEAIIKANNL